MEAVGAPTCPMSQASILFLPSQRPHLMAICTVARAPLKGWASAWVLGAALSASAETMPPPRSTHPAQKPPTITTVALSPPRAQAAGRPRPGPAAGSKPASTSTTHNGSHIPTPIDNPWALGMLAALAARMLWMDRRSKQGHGSERERPNPRG